MLITTTALLAALTLAGCTAGSGASTDESGGSSGLEGPAAPAQRDDGTVVGVDGEVDSAGGGELSPVEADRDVVTTGWMTVTVDDAADAAGDAARIADEAGGRVDARTEYAADDDRAASAVLTLRIPADRLEDALVELKALGEVQQVQQEVSDVTAQVRDLDARISALRATIQRFEGLVTNAATLDDLITLEQAISDRQAQLESMESQQRAIADQVSMSTMQVTLQSESVAPARTPGTFLDGLATGWAAFVAFGSALLVGLGVLLPWLVSAGIVVLVILVLVRRLRKVRPQLAGPVPAAGPLEGPLDGPSSDDPSEPAAARR